jgi:hypothetical protein
MGIRFELMEIVVFEPRRSVGLPGAQYNTLEDYPHLLPIRIQFTPPIPIGA